MLVANTAWNLWNYRKALIKILEKEGFNILLLAPADRFTGFLEDNPSTTFLPLRNLSRKSFSPLRNFRLLLELLHIFKTQSPDLLVLFTVKPNLLGNLAASWTHIPAISVVEGLGYSGASSFFWRWIAAPLYRLAFLKTQKVVFLNGEDYREFLQLHLVRPKQAVLIPGPGIDTDAFHCPEKPSTAPVVFLYSGRLLAAKGIREFVEAARQLHREQASVSFLVAGAPDPENPDSIAITDIQLWEAEGIVRFLGYIEDIRPVLRQADVLVLPSYYREGLPKSILEAMAMGKIILTTDTPGCRDTVEPGLNGFLVPPKNNKALAEAMRRLLQLSPDERLRMSRHSLEKVHAQFSDAQIVPLYLALINAVLKERPSGHTPMLRPPR